MEKIQTKCLKSKLEHQTTRKEELENEITRYFIQEGDSNYDAKEENQLLSNQVGHWLSYSRKLEADLEDTKRERDHLIQ
jgi:hypothetical protein